MSARFGGTRHAFTIQGGEGPTTGASGAFFEYMAQQSPREGAAAGSPDNRCADMKTLPGLTFLAARRGCATRALLTAPLPESFGTACYGPFTAIPRVGVCR